MDVEFEDAPNTVKNRPVIIIDERENDVLILVSTTSKPRKDPPRYYDQYKIPIPNWRKAGLDRASWCKGKNLIRIAKDHLRNDLRQSGYIGKIPPHDFHFIIEELEKIHGK